MPRYIDADKLVAWCMRTYQAQSTVAGKASVIAFLTAVDYCPTADVVPKSEYDRLEKLFKDMTQEARGYLNRIYGIRAEIAIMKIFGERGDTYELREALKKAGFDYDKEVKRLIEGE